MNSSEKDFQYQENLPTWQEDYLQELWGELNSHISDFVGRQEWLEELNNWVEVNPSGYFLLTGAPGQGKSALLAKFTQIQQNTCFIQMCRTRKNPARILQFLIWQAASAEYGLSSDSYYSSLDNLRFYLMSELSNLLKTDKIIVVIDNLDLLDINDLIKILPINLPENIYFFLACRENAPLINVLAKQLQKITIKTLTPLSSKETRLLFNTHLIANQLEYLSKNIEFQLLLKVTIKMLLVESQNNITLLKLIIENIINKIKQNITDSLGLEISFSQNNIKLTFVTLYNKLLLISKQTTKFTKLDQKNVKLIIGLLAVNYEVLTTNQLFEILCINNVDISKEQIEHYLSQIEHYLITLPNSKKTFFHHHFNSFIIDKLIETKEIILIYDLIINWLDNIKEGFLYYYLNYIDSYLLEFTFICLKLNDKVKAKEVFVKLINLLTNIRFINDKIKVGMFDELIASYKKTIASIPDDLEIDNKNNLLIWFRFLDSESYTIKNIELNIFLQQAINQTIENNISEAALDYLKKLDLSYVYLNWINKPVEHIYKALKETLIDNIIGIQALKLTSDNKYLITASEDSKIKIWDLLTKQEISTLIGHSGIIFSLIIDINNKYIISGDSNSIVNIWDLTTKQLLLSLKEHNGSILSLLLTLDNKYLISTSADRSVKIWEFNLEILNNSPKSLLTLTEHNSIINTLTITQDNQYIVLGSNDGKIIIWDLINKQQIISLFGHDFGVTSLAVTLNNTYLISAGEDRTIKVWDLATKTLAATLTGATSSISKIKITSDNQFIIAGSNDKTIHIWNLATGLPITALTGHNDLITDIEITSDNQFIISSSKDGAVKLWDLEYAKASIIQTKQRFNLSAVAISGDGSLGVVGETSGLIKIWNINNKQEIATLNAHKNTINALALTSDNKYLASASDDFQVKIWDLTTLTCVAILNDHQDRVLTLLITLDNKYVISGGDDKTIKIWDLDKKQLDTTLIDKAGVYALMLGQDNKQFASANFRGKLRLWDLATKRIIKEHKGWFDTKTAITKNSKYQVLRFEDNTLRVLDTTNEMIIAIFPTISLVTRCAISDNGVIISCDQLGNLYFLKLENVQY